MEKSKALKPLSKTKNQVVLQEKLQNGSALQPKSNKKMMKQTRSSVQRAAPILNQRSPEIQKFGERFSVPIGIEEKAVDRSVEILNQVLADTIMLRDMYKKHHWQVSGHTFYQLHLLLDKHYNEQAELVDMLAERIQAFGGISIAMPHDVAEMSKLERPPKGREEVPVQLSRLLEAHEVILKESRKGAKEADENGDDGTNDILVSNVIRTNELQVWFISEHLVSLPVVRSDAADVNESH